MNLNRVVQLSRCSRTLFGAASRRCYPAPRRTWTPYRTFQTSQCRHAERESGPTLYNMLAGDKPLPVQVNSINEEGIKLSDGLLLPSSCIFLEGNVFLWDVHSSLWSGWKKEHFEIFEVVVPKPEILVLGTGATLSRPPDFIRTYLSQIGIQLEIADTRNACSTYNLLSEEGRRVAAALLPLSPEAWTRTQPAA